MQPRLRLIPVEYDQMLAAQAPGQRRAVRQGVSPDGEPYYPAFPYPFYAVLSDKDIADLWAAFRTVPAVAAFPG